MRLSNKYLVLDGLGIYPAAVLDDFRRYVQTSYRLRPVSSAVGRARRISAETRLHGSWQTDDLNLSN